ncbi:MAG: hydrogenase expression/formation protein HypE [Gracilibacteraceae bacterium]|jgi:hydrogenase expression/formation protein HypE|nr:hydrogenase expression/formation protein HypE [Gracilibacteraceae bacterium]
MKKITMAHGSGGQETRTLVTELFQSRLGNEYLDRLEDAAVLPRPAYPIALTTDTFVITPPEFPGADIGKLAVCGTVNDLWMSGARPLYLTAGFVLAEGLELALLERVVTSMARAAQAAGVRIVAGDTKVVENAGAAGSGLFINTAGLGCRCWAYPSGPATVRPGDAVILSGPLGNHHAAVISHRLGISNSILSDCADLGPLINALLEGGVRVRALRDVTRGGLATILNEIAVAAGARITAEEKLIPVEAEVEALCGLLGLDPLYMANEGKFVCVVAAEEGEKALGLLRAFPLGARAVAIGRVEALPAPDAAWPGAEPPVTLRTTLGGRRILDLLYGEGLPRIC